MVRHQHCIPIQRQGLVLLLNLLSLPNTNAMSDLVHDIAYIKDPINFEYSNCEASCPVCLVNFILGYMGFETGVVYNMLNFLSGFSIELA